MSLTAFAADITATWSIEEGATLESFTEATITFTGVEAATTTSMYPACFYKVAEDGTLALVENYCTAGVLDRTATGASIKLWVDEETGCYEGKITAGNYRIVLSTGMVKFNNDNSNKNTEEYVLNFSIAGSDEPALEEIDAVYTVNPENNATVTEIREIVLNFTGYETIAVAEPDMVNGSNIPTVYFEDELTGAMMPAGYIMFKADSLSANGLRLYVDPMYTGGAESYAAEGKYAINIPAGVVTFSDGISKAITLNYTVKAEEVVEPTTPIVEGTKLYLKSYLGVASASSYEYKVVFGEFTVPSSGGGLKPGTGGLKPLAETATATEVAMTTVYTKEGKYNIWEVVAPAGTADSIFTIIISRRNVVQGYITPLKYDGVNNLFQLPDGFSFPRNTNVVNETAGEWGVYVEGVDPDPDPELVGNITAGLQFYFDFSANETWNALTGLKAKFTNSNGGTETVEMTQLADSTTWTVVVPEGLWQSFTVGTFKIMAPSINDLTYDDTNNLYTLDAEGNGTWSVYVEKTEPNVITATWSIEEGATLESFTEATITFTGVEAATTTSMYPACFYKVAEDGTLALVENYCTAGVLDRTATGASIKLWVDEETGCYEGKITAGNYRIVLSTGMVKFNNDNSNKNTEEYVLNFSIAGSDEPALEEIDAVYTVNPENNATVTEIREIVLNFTGYETIAVAEPDMVNGSNIPTVYFEDELTGAMMPAGYIMFKADSLSANGLRLYVDPMYTGGAESYAAEGKYAINIPAGVVTFSDGISKAITLNYTVEQLKSAIIEGKVKRALQTGTASIILTHEEDGTAHIYSVDNETWFVTELSQEGVIARDPENVGDYLAISDIALTEDGKLVACNYIRCQFNDDSVESGYKRGTLNVYIWNDMAGAPSIWFQSKASSNSLKSDQGYTMAVKGTSTNANVLVSGVHNSHRGIRMSRFNVIDGQFVDTKDGAGALPYYYYIGSNFKGASAGVDAAVYNEAAHGVNIQFNASPLVDTAWIFDAELVEPSEFLDKGTNGAEVVVNANIAEGTFGKKYNGASYLKVGERLIMAAPYANEEGLLAGVKVLDITNGFAEAVELNAKVDLEEAVEATSAAVTIVADAEGFMTTYLFADSKLYVLAVEEPVITEMEAKNAYAYDVKVEANEDKTVATVSYRLNAPAVAVKVYAKVEGEVVREVEGTTLCRYADGVADNLNIVEVSLEGLSGNVSFEVAVEGTLVETPTEVAKNYRFYHPQGVDVDVNPESEFFGRAYVTENMPVAKAGDTYISDVNGNGVAQGLYAFDATLTPIANKDGKYGFIGGLTFEEYLPNDTRAYEPRKVRLSEDGRLFITRQNVGVSPLVEVNPADLDANFTEVFTDFVCDSATYHLNTAEGEFIAAPNIAFDVKGLGENLTVAMLSCNLSGFGYGTAGFHTDEYKLGEATTWSAAPSNRISALDNYSINYAALSIEYDNEGGIWYCQYRGTPKETEPALIHVNAQGVEDYKNTTLVARSSGLRLNAEGTLLAVAGNNGKKCTIFEVGKDTEGKPTLTAKYEFDTNIGNNLNDIAWDYANNLYLVGNSGEYLKVFALPRESAVVTTPAAERYAIQMPLPMEVEFENIAAIYEMGMWDMAYYESYSNYEVVALLKSQPTVVDKVVTSGMMGGNMNNYYLNDGTGVIVLQAEGDRYEPITDENWDVIGWDTIPGLTIEVGKKLPVDFMANIDFKTVTDEETWLPTGEVYGAPVMTFVPKATGDVIVDEYGWETIVTESNEEFAARCEASDFVEEAVEANIDDVLANRINYAGKLLTLNAEAKYYAESNPYMGTMSAYMYWDAEEAFEVETYEEDGSTIVYVSPKYTEDYNNFAGKLFNVNGEELPEAAFDANVTIDVVKARFDWNSIAQGQTLVVKEYEVKVPGDPVDVENGELVVNIYSNNGSVYVEAEAGAMIEVYTVNGLRVYAGVSNTNTTVINGLNTNIAIIRVNGETYKVFVK